MGVLCLLLMPLAQAGDAPARPGLFPSFNPQIDRTLSAQNIAVETWLSRLRRLGLTVPLEAKGTVSGSLRARVPVRESTDATAWKLDGRLTSPALTVSGVTLNELSVTLRLRDGVLALEDLSFRLGNGDGDGDRVRGSGSLPVSPPGDLSLAVAVDRVDLARFARFLPKTQASCDDPTPVDARLVGTVSARLEASVPPRQVADPTAWTASGPFRIDDVQLGALPALSTAGQLSLTDGAATAALSTFTLPGITATGTLTLQPQAGLPFTGTLRGPIEPDVALRSLVAVDLDTGGTLDADLAVEGTVSPFAISLTGPATTDALQVASGPLAATVAGRGQVAYRFDTAAKRSQFAARELAIDFAGGSVTGDVVVALPTDRCDRDNVGDSRLQLAASAVPAGALMQAVGVDSAIAVSGTLDGRADITVTGSRWTTPSAYRGTARTASERITLGPDAVSLDTVTAAVEMTQAGLRIDEATAAVGPSGRLAASGAIPWETVKGRRLVGDADASWEQVPAELLVSVAGLAADVPAAWATGWGGQTSGRVSLTPTDQNRWRIDAAARLERLQRLGVELADVDLTAGGTAADLTATVRGTLLGGPLEATVRRRENATLVRGRIEQVETATLAQAVPEWPRDWQPRGVFTASVEAGQAGDQRWQLTATGRSPELAIGPRAVADAAVEVRASSERLWAEVSGQVDAGRLTLAVEQPRGGGTIVGQASAEAVPAEWLLEPLLDGTVDGTVDAESEWVIGAGDGPLLDRVRGAGSLRADAVAWQPPRERGPVEVRIEKWAVDIRKSPTLVWMQAAGQLFGGRIDLTASQDRQTADEPLRIRAAAEGIVIEQVRTAAAIVQPSLTGVNVGGQLSGELLAAVPMRAGRPVLEGVQVTGPFQLTRVLVNDRTLTNGLSGQIVWTDRERALANLSGTLGGGQLTGEVAIPAPDSQEPRRWALSVRGIQPARVGQFVGRAIPLTGTVNVSLAGQTRPDRSVLADGRVTLSGGRLGSPGGGLPISRVSVPLSLTYQAASDRIDARLRSARLSVGRGQVTGNARLSVGTVSVDPRIAVDADLKLVRVDLATLSAAAGSRTVQGTLSGSVTLRAKRLRTLGDLSGAAAIDFANPAAGGSPALNAITPVAGVKVNGFRTGRLEATLAGSRLTVRRLSLSGVAADLFASGTVGLDASPRGAPIDLDVVIATGQPEEGLLQSAIVQRAITLASPGVGVLIAANEALRDRVVHLTVTGTTRSPQVRVEPLQTAREAGLRFLLRSAVGG